MKSIRRTLLTLFVLIVVSTGVFAADGWWQGKAITDFEYFGASGGPLKNVSEKTLDSLLSGYLDEPFSDELFTEIYNKLYSQSYVEYVSAEAIAGGETGDDLIIRFSILVGAVTSSTRTILSPMRLSSQTITGARDTRMS